jgi:ABC-type nitrate/sulfonate/bicarbonate transport system substrate-binding protein
MKRNFIFLFGLTLWAFALPCENAGAQTVVVRIGYSGGGTAKNLHKTIEKAGLWKKRSLDVRLIYFTSGATWPKPWSAATST